MDADKCGWQTESGTVNSPAFCNRSVEIGYSYCAEHERDAAELYTGVGIGAIRLQVKGC